jgi:hypothetical protein
MCLDGSEAQGHPEGGSHHRKMCKCFSNLASVNKSLRVLAWGGLSPVHMCVTLVDRQQKKKEGGNLLAFR